MAPRAARVRPSGRFRDLHEDNGAGWRSTMDDAPAEFRRLVQLIEAKEYYAVGASRRFQAAQRRLTWGATRVAMLVVAVAAPLHVLVLSALHPAALGLVLAVDGTLGIVALVAWWALGGPLRHRPEAVAFVVSLLVALAAMILGLADSELVVLGMAYLVFLPTVVALVIPWRTWTEVRWLAVYAVVASAFIVLSPDDRLTAAERRDLVVTLVVALAASFTGHVLLFREHIRTFSQMQAIARLHRRENSQRVELERVYRSLEITARTDELTRVGNRMKLDEDLVVIRARIARTGRPVGLLEVDLDHFKAVNDHLGHLAGDAVLREVARILCETVRADDAVYRYGGEEFLVVLGSIAGGVEAAGERIRQAVESLGMVHPDNPPHGLVTISVGATALGPIDLPLDTDRWFARVDAALYEAKAAGRNRVAVAPQADPPPDPAPEQPTARSGVARRVGGATLGQGT